MPTSYKKGVFAHLTESPLIERIENLPVVLLKIFEFMLDGEWHTVADAIRVTGQNDAGKRLRGLRECGFSIEMRKWTEQKIARYAYRLLDNCAPHAGLACSRSRRKGIKPREKFSFTDEVDDGTKISRGTNWMRGAQTGYRAAVQELETGVKAKCPYAQSAYAERRGWKLAYDAMINDGENILTNYRADVKRNQPQTLKTGDGLTVDKIRAALMDWEHQERGLIVTRHDAYHRPGYGPCPELTDEDKAFAREQANKCRRALLDMGVRP